MEVQALYPGQTVFVRATIVNALGSKVTVQQHTIKVVNPNNVTIMTLTSAMRLDNGDYEVSFQIPKGSVSGVYTVAWEAQWLGETSYNETRFKVQERQALGAEENAVLETRLKFSFGEIIFEQNSEQLQGQARLVTLRDAVAKREAATSIRENKVEAGRFVIPLKGYLAFYRFTDLVPEEVAKWFKPDVLEKGVVAEKKYDGVHCQILKDDGSVVIRSEDGADVTKRFPTIVGKVKSKFPDTVTLDAEVEYWKDNVHQARENVAGYLHLRSPPDDKPFVFNVFDMMYLKGKDLHELPYSERLRLLKTLPFDQSTNGIPRTPSLNLTPTVLAKTPQDLVQAVKRQSAAIASEGSVVKALVMPYALTGISRYMLKFKKMAELHAVVLKADETKTPDVYVLHLGLRIPSGWKVPKKLLYQVGNKTYMWMSKTFNVKGVKRPGTIISMTFHTLNYYKNSKTGEQWVAAYEPKFIDVREGQTAPDDAEEAVRIAKEKELLAIKQLESLQLPMDDKPHRSVMQNHHRCDFEEYLPFEAGLPGSPKFEKALNELIASQEFDFLLSVKLEESPTDPLKVFMGRSAHLDWRIAVNHFLDGFTIAHMQPGRIKEDVDTLKKAKDIESRWDYYFKMNNKPQTYQESLRRKLWVEPKKSEPFNWINVEGVVAPGNVGATRHEFGTFNIVDKPTVYIGTQKPDFMEFFLYGQKFTGRWVIRLLPNPWKEEMPREDFVMLMWKPEDQMPYVLSDRAVKKQWIPPYGVSAVPPEIRQQIPEQYRYWKQQQPKARMAMRDELVQLLKKDEVKIHPVEVVKRKE